MISKLPILHVRKVCKFLAKQGFSPIRQSGSHVIWVHSDGRQTIVPYHTNKPISRGLLSSILDHINISRENFLRHYKK